MRDDNNLIKCSYSHTPLINGDSSLLQYQTVMIKYNQSSFDCCRLPFGQSKACVSKWSFSRHHAATRDQIVAFDKALSTEESQIYIYRLLHRKCDVRIFIHELQNFGKRMSERSERVSFPKFCNS